MIGRANRFHGRGSILPVYKQGKVVRGDGLSLHYRPNPRRHNYRLAVVVSKKVHKSAVLRNRIRRRIYEVAKELLNKQLGQDLIITVHNQDLASIEAKELKKRISDLLKKANTT